MILVIVILSNLAFAQEQPPHLQQFLKAEQMHNGRKLRKELLPHARAAIAGQKSNPDAWAILAESEFLNGNWLRSIAAYKEAIRLGPSMYRWRHFAQVGRSYAELGQIDLAFTWLNRALRDRYQERDDFREDAHLENLRSDPRFNELAGLPPANITERGDRWRYDLAFYKREVLRLHPNPYFRLPKEKFDRAFQAIIDSIDEKTDAELIVALQRFSGMWGDGHSNGRLHRYEIFQDQLLPFRFAFFAEGLFIVGVQPGWEHVYGARVVSVDGFPGAKILAAVTKMTGRDYEGGWPKEYASQELRVGAYLQAITGSPSPRKFRLKLELDGKVSEHVVTVGAHHFYDRPLFRTSLNPSPLLAKVPFYLSRPTEKFWMQEFGKTLYVQPNIAHDKEDMTYAEFAAQVHKALSDRNRLIIDARLFPGGDGYLIKHLTKVIVGFDAADPNHEIYVITSARTFSAAIGFTTDIDRLTDAVFVGEPPGSSPNNYGESTRVLLPFANVAFGVSCFYSQASTPEDKRSFVAPEWPIQLRAADYFAGRDPVLEHLLPEATR